MTKLKMQVVLLALCLAAVLTAKHYVDRFLMVAEPVDMMQAASHSEVSVEASTKD